MNEFEIGKMYRFINATKDQIHSYGRWCYEDTIVVLEERNGLSAKRYRVLTENGNVLTVSLWSGEWRQVCQK